MSSNVVASGNLDHVNRQEMKLKDYQKIERPKIIKLCNKSMFEY